MSQKIDIKKEFKKGISSIQKNRFTHKGGYKIDRWIFKTFMLLVLVYLFYVAYSYDFDLEYLKCPIGGEGGTISGPKVMLNNFEVGNKAGLCKNPFYKASSWKNEEYLPPGEYGNQLGLNFKFASYFATLMVIIALLLNHFIYNRNFGLFKKLRKMSEEEE